MQSNGIRIDEHLDGRQRFRGGVLAYKLFRDGRKEIVVDDRNMVVSLGRRVMSRIISGAAGTPDILRTQQPGLRVIRGTAGGVTAAWITFEQIPGSNEYKLSGYTNVSSPEFALQFTSGTFTLTTLAAAIGGQAGGNKWAADVLGSGSLANIDAVQLVQTPRADCIGNAANYAAVPANSPYTRRMYVIATKTDSITPDDVSDLTVTKIRCGTQGHQPLATTLGKDVLATDESLTSSLRASDLGNGNESDDSLACVIEYPNTSHVSFTATLGLSQGNGLDISEFGLFTAGDYLVARKNFGKLNKQDAFSLVISWILIF